MDYLKYKPELLSFPKEISHPVRTDYKNHTEYGMAMDTYEVEVATRKDKCRAIRKENMQREKECLDRFRQDLIKDLGWEWLSPIQFDQVWFLIWEERHSSGLSSVYDMAKNMAVLLDTFKPTSLS